MLQPQAIFRAQGKVAAMSTSMRGALPSQLTSPSTSYARVGGGSAATILLTPPTRPISAFRRGWAPRRAAVSVSARRDPWDTLGLSADSNEKQIKKAYRKLALKHHPDVSKEPDAQLRFLAVQEAYEILTGKHRGKELDGSHWSQQQDGWDFHDWYWSFRMERTWKRRGKGEGSASPPPRPAPSAGAWRSQMDGLKRRAVNRNGKPPRRPAAAPASEPQAPRPAQPAAQQPRQHHERRPAAASTGQRGSSAAAQPRGTTVHTATAAAAASRQAAPQRHAAPAHQQRPPLHTTAPRAEPPAARPPRQGPAAAHGLGASLRWLVSGLVARSGAGAAGQEAEEAAPGHRVLALGSLLQAGLAQHHAAVRRVQHGHVHLARSAADALQQLWGSSLQDSVWSSALGGGPDAHDPHPGLRHAHAWAPVPQSRAGHLGALHTAARSSAGLHQAHAASARLLDRRQAAICAAAVVEKLHEQLLQSRASPHAPEPHLHAAAEGRAAPAVARAAQGSGAAGEEQAGEWQQEQQQRRQRFHADDRTRGQVTSQLAGLKRKAAMKQRVYNE